VAPRLRFFLLCKSGKGREKEKEKNSALALKGVWEKKEREEEGFTFEPAREKSVAHRRRGERAAAPPLTVQKKKERSACSKWRAKKKSGSFLTTFKERRPHRPRTRQPRESSRYSKPSDADIARKEGWPIRKGGEGSCLSSRRKKRLSMIPF